MEFKVNDLVLCNDELIIYQIISINNLNAIILGLTHRIQKEVLLSNLVKATNADIENEEKINKRYLFQVTSKKERLKKNKYLLGKVLHIDQDKQYLEKSLMLYEEIGLYAYGICLNNLEKKTISKLLDEINPDIVVVTGHDLYNNQGISNLDNYINTKLFMDITKIIRNKKSNGCVIIAGACQSNYEALIASGADFASSPKRINIHTFDPAIIAIKVATTSFMQSVDLNEVFKYIENGKDAFSGLQTLGKMRLML